MDFFNIKVERRHRAGPDAEAVARLMLALIELLEGLGLSTVQVINRLLSGTTSPLRPLFETVTQKLAQEGFSQKIRVPRWDRERLQNFAWVAGEVRGNRQAKDFRQRMPADRMVEVFEPGGILERRLNDYEYRPQQVEMIREVVQAFNRSEFLLVEAGTGTGKSLAYLVPAIHWAVENGERVIISTKTKNLQEQLFFKDIPLLQGVLDVPFQAVLLKGRANYLCLNKWHSVLLEPELKLTPEEQVEILPLVTWLEETATGDVSENTGFNLNRNLSLWNKLCSESDYCLEQRCKYFDRCFLQRVRQAARQAQIVVVNHSLLFSDLASDNTILSNYMYLIFDEAHNVEKVATEYLGRELSLWRVRNLLDRLYAREAVETGLLVSLHRKVEHIGKEALREAFLAQIELVTELVELGWRAAGDFFHHLAQRVLQGTTGPDGHYRRKLRYKRDSNLFDPDSVEGLIGALGCLRVELSKLAEWIRDLPEGAIDSREEILHDLAARTLECEAIIDDTLFLTGAEDDDSVYWLELPPREGRSNVRLLAAPLNIGELMKVYLYDRLHCIVFTSATLTVGDSFDYIIARLGLNLVEPEGLRTLALGSPFDYHRQALVCVPTFLPSPKDERFQVEVSQLMEELTTTLRRGDLGPVHLLRYAYPDLLGFEARFRGGGYLAAGSRIGWLPIEYHGPV